MLSEAPIMSAGLRPGTLCFPAMPRVSSACSFEALPLAEDRSVRTSAFARMNMFERTVVWERWL